MEAQRDIKRLKNKSIINFLKNLGHTPTFIKGENYHYLSPLRSEKEASFNVHATKNIWYDHGLGTGGDIIDLVCVIYHVNKSGACGILARTVIQEYLPTGRQIHAENKITVRHVQPLQNKALLQYLESRAIHPDTAKPYVQEAYYYSHSKEKQYFSLAFANDKGGFELRNRYFKGSTSPKYLTTIEGQRSDCFNVFEGFMDFLSALEYFKMEKPNYTTIILNSLSNLPHAKILLTSAKTVNLYFDNDTSGRKATVTASKWIKNKVDQSGKIYRGKKDLNALLMQNLTTI